MTGDLVPRTAGEVADFEQFETVLLDALAAVGLPTEGVLVPVLERQAVFAGFGHALGRLTPERIAASLYLSKFMAAVRSGLFDAALNYLWDETVSELRRRIAGYDIAYFFDLAVTDPQRRNQLRTVEDLIKVGDADLIAAANQMGLISDTGYRQLDLVRFMRNYASAAHPNQNELTGLQLVGWLDTCIVEVITLPESVVVVGIRRLLSNIRMGRMDQVEASAVAATFGSLPQEQADNLANGLFGIYTNLDTTNDTRDNVRLLYPRLWEHLTEDAKRGFGVKFGRYLANNDAQQAHLARELLATVDASGYLPENLRVAHIDQALDDLMAAHRGMNNFYTEPALARALESAVGSRGEVPRSVGRKYVRCLVEVFLSNGNGIAWNADPAYRKLLSALDVQEAELALRTFAEPTIASRLQARIAQTQWAELLKILAPKVSSRPARDLLLAVQQFTGPAAMMAHDTKIKTALLATTGS